MVSATPADRCIVYRQMSLLIAERQALDLAAVSARKIHTGPSVSAANVQHASTALESEHRNTVVE